ncbi:unnamed protein product [Didymodactylos carnosus]|uniref:Thioredoxin-like fold domain-containing protein n=1 Tax=Didymodactylos carnosus TaxID=1234261 RepID=A0A814UBH3_9BILA|nr:unnamed protein product [Didymodactylos carnosus]CAF1172177.1 unnamed protein product [Didymodactylos carnosus]CAF3531784.1 unnamed protein product [Didymodactylos carnosus]CAF3936073.1 unnamed protein product [Didymodactylos carnosus]
MYADLLCPDCQAAWPTILKVIDYYGPNIQVLLHPFPLPYHTNAFIAAQGLHVVSNVTNRDLNAIYLYATLIFQNQSTWYNRATIDMSTNEVVQSLATFVDKTQITTAAKFLAGLQDDDINDQTRISWKYACSRNVASTPTFMINGVFVSADASWSLDDWKSVIDPMLDCPPGLVRCNYAPNKSECCVFGYKCVPNFGCICFKDGKQC